MRKIKFLFCLVLLHAVFLSQILCVWAGDVLLKVNGIIQNIAVVNREGNVFISLADASKIFDFQYFIDYDLGRGFTIKKDDLTIKIFKEQNYVEVNGEKLYLLNVPIYSEENIIMLPVRGLCKCLNITPEWDASSKTISIAVEYTDTAEKNNSSIENQAANIISFDEALKKSIQNNSSLKNLEDNLEYLDDAHQKAVENYDELSVNINAPLEQITATLTQMSALSQNIKSIENQLGNRSLNETILKDSVEYTLRSYLTTIETAKINIAIQKQVLELKQKEIENIKLRNKLGMTGDIDLQTAQNSYEQEKLTLKALETNLDSTKNLLKKLLSTNIDYEIIFEPGNELFTEEMEYYIVRQLLSSPDIILKEKEYDLAKYILDTHENLTDELESEKENNLSKALRDLEDAKAQLEANIRIAYNNLKNLEDTQRNLQLELEKAKDNYNKMVISYKNGMISKYDLDAASMQLIQIEANLKKNAYERALLVFTLERPYLIIN